MSKPGTSPGPRVLLLVSGSTLNTGVGNQFLTPLISGLEGLELARCSLVPPGEEAPATEWLGHPAYHASGSNSALPLLPAAQYWATQCRRAQAAVDRFTSAAEGFQPDLIWVVANSPLSTDVGLALQARLSLPLVSLVWDLPSWYTRRMDPFTRRHIEGRFRRLLDCSERVAAMGVGGNAPHFQSLYGVPLVTMHSAAPPHTWRRLRTPPEPDPDRNIVLAGGIYAKREWNALVRAACRANAEQSAQRLVVHHMGRWPRLGVAAGAPVQRHGRLAPHELQRALRDMTLAYVPYSLSRLHRDAMLTAFPAKFVTSVAAGLPVLFHGPPESLPALFLERYPVGTVCTSYRAGALLESIEYLLTDPEFRTNYAATRERAYREELSTAAMVGRLAALLGYPPRCILGSSCTGGRSRSPGSRAPSASSG